MISIIVSSYKPTLFTRFEDNVKKTIGLPYEIINIANPNLMSICKAYNLGAAKAQYNLLCFVHEDVEFISNNWGIAILNLFNNNSNIGLAGLAGSKYKSNFLSGWETGLNEFDRINLHQKLLNGDTVRITKNPDQEAYSEVITLDGVCLFTTKENWVNIKFNEEELKGFHFYDLDFSLKTVFNNKKVVVIYFIDVIHFSVGRFNNTWINEALKFHKNSSIQKILKSISNNNIKKEKLDHIKLYWVYRLANENISIYNKYRVLVQNYGLLNKENFQNTVSLFLKQQKHNISSKLLSKL